MTLVLAFLAKNWRLVLMGVFVALLGVQTARLSHAKGDLVNARGQLVNTRAQLATALASLKLSEDKRSVEFSRAVSSAGEAEDACSARVAAVRRSASAIRAIVQRPVVVDATGCPARVVVGAEDLRRALQP